MREPLDLRSDPLYVKVYELLKDWILQGRLGPGTPLKETQLAADLNVSRTPVRDALRRLELDRLIVAAQGPTYEVYLPTENDLSDLYSARAILEGGAARLAAERGDRSAVEGMDEVLTQMRVAYQGPDPRQIVELDTRFHELMLCASGNPVLVELHSHLSIRLRHARSLSGDITGRQKKVLEQHAAMIEALRSGDGDAAQAATHAHILSVFQAARDAFRERHANIHAERK